MEHTVGKEEISANRSPFRGAVFENWCVTETLKWFHSRGERPGLCFWRDQLMEVDLVIETKSGKISAFEFKSAAAPPPDALINPINLARIMKDNQMDPSVFFGGDESQQRSNGALLSWRDFTFGKCSDQH